MTKIYLIRHAEAEGNIYRRAHGHFNGQIIGRGFKQIEQLKNRFENEEIDAVYSSDLSRTCVTAAPICRQHGLQLSTTDRLREVNVGVWEDVAWGDLEYNDPDMSQNFSKDPARWRVDGSEEYTHVQARMTECISEIARRHDGGAAAVFSHGFAIRAFICGVSGIASKDIMKVPYCDNTAVALLRYENGEPTIEYQSDNSHLSNEISTFAHQTWWREEKEWVSENLRYMPFDEKRDSTLAKLCFDEMGKRFGANKEYTAFLANESVGVIGVDTSKENGNEAGRISYISVKPDLRRKNYGVQLLGHAVSMFRGLGRDKLRIEVDADAPALSFCLKYEFEIVKKTGSLCLLEKNIRNW